MRIRRGRWGSKKVTAPRPGLSEMLAVACAVSVGAALVTFCLILGESSLRASIPPERLAKADVVISGNQSVPVDEDFDIGLPDHAGVDEALLDELEAMPGVEGAAGDIRFPAVIVDESGVVSAGDPPGRGHNWSSLPPSGELSGNAPRAPQDVVLTTDLAGAAGVAVGDSVETVLAGDPVTMTVSGIVTGVGGGVFVTDEVARGLSTRDSGTVDLIAVTVAESAVVATVAAQIEHATADDDLVVSTGAAIGDAEHPEASSSRGLLMAMAGSGGGVVLVLVGFLVAGAVSISVTNRARELALMRAVGATPRQVRGMVTRQMSMVSLVALIPGVVVGYLGASAMQGTLGAAGLLYRDQELAWSPVPAGAAIVLSLVVVKVAARGASARLSRQSAVSAMAISQTEPATGGRVRVWVGVALLVLSAGSAVVPLVTRSEAALISATSGVLLSVIGLALVAPAAVRRIAGRLGRQPISVSRWLAVHHTGAYALRTGGAVAVLAMAVGLILIQVFSGSTLATVTQDESRQGSLAAATVSAPDVGGVAPGAVDEMAAIPEVSAAVPVARSMLALPRVDDGAVTADEHPLLAVGPGSTAVLDPDVVDGSMDDLAGEAVALESTFAWIRGVGIGDRLEVILSDGTPAEPRIVATYERGFAFGKVIASTDLIRDVGPLTFDGVMLAGDDAAAVQDVLSPVLTDYPGSQVEPEGIAAVGESPGVEVTHWLNLAFSLVLVGYVMLGIANRLVAVTLRRKREWENLRAIGATPRQIRAMVRTEVGLVCAGAVIGGTVLALAPMAVVGAGLLGRPWPHGPAWVVVATLVAVSVIAYAATMLPARRVLSSSLR